MGKNPPWSVRKRVVVPSERLSICATCVEQHRSGYRKGKRIRQTVRRNRRKFTNVQENKKKGSAAATKKQGKEVQVFLVHVVRPPGYGAARRLNANRSRYKAPCGAVIVDTFPPGTVLPCATRSRDTQTEARERQTDRQPSEKD